MPSNQYLMNIIESGENDRIEFTEATNDMDKIRQAICAFANDLPAYGMPGFIFIGIRDDGSCADLNLQIFENDYMPQAVSPEALAANERSRPEQLQALRLSTQNDLPSVTAILTLGKDPQYWFPGAYVQFVRYNGIEVTDAIVDHREISGVLPEQLLELDRVLKANISQALDTSGDLHKENPDYPFVALRELVRNAVIHRNYENSNTPVRIHWFTDNIQIVSPGSVYGAVTQENFGQPGITDYRNPTIAEAMKNLGFMQRFGIGIATANRALAENNNPPVEFDVQENFLTATVKKQR